MCTVGVVRYGATGFSVPIAYLDLPPTLVARAEYLAIILAGGAVALFYNQLYRSIPEKIMKGFLILGTFWSFATLFFDMRQLNQYLAIFQLYATIGIFSAIFIIVRGLFRGVNTPKLVSLMAVLILLGFSLIEMMYYQRIDLGLSVQYISGVSGFSCLIIAQSVSMSIKFNRAFQDVEISQLKITSLNKKLEEHNQNLEKTVQEKTKSIREILINIKQGILTFKDDFLINPEYSAYLEVMFGQKNLGEKALDEVVWAKSGISSDRLDAMKACLISSFDEELEFGWEINAGNMINEFDIEVKGRTRHFEIDWNPVLDDENQVVSMLAAIKDVTEVNELRKASREQELKQSIILQMIYSPRKAEKFVRRTLEQEKEVFENLETFLDDHDSFTMSIEFSTLSRATRGP